MSERLRADPRTSWATHVYQQIAHYPAIDDHVAEYVLSWLGSEHAEILTRGVSGRRRPIKWTKAKSTGLVVRSPSRSLLIYDDLTGHQWASGFSSQLRARNNYVWGTGNALFAREDSLVDDVRADVDSFVAFRVDGGTIAQAFTPTLEVARCLIMGAGQHILRLPERSDVPPIPDIEDRDTEDLARSLRPRILTGWASVEELAEEHLRSIGIHDAERTQGGADGGLDVVSSRVVAQVKQTAKPVGRPILQALVGAAEPGQSAVCYATAGYTGEAIEYAEARDISLYQISGLGKITAVNDQPRLLERSYGAAAHAWHAAGEYSNQVKHRSLAALLTLNPDLDFAPVNMSTYLSKAVTMLSEPPQFKAPREMAVHFHHAELLLAMWATYVHGHYPSDAELPTRRANWPDSTGRPPELSDFY